MFIGHFGLGFGMKKVAPALSLGLLFIAVQFVDLLWPTLLLLDIEHVAITPGRVTPLNFIDYPITHSLIMVIGWGFLFGLVYWLFKKNVKNAVILGLLVVSHWVIDLIVHLPDLPLYPGNSPKVGFGLWNYFWITAIIEGIIYFVGAWYYAQATTAKNTSGKYGLWVLVILLALVHLSSGLGPPPPSVTALAWSAQLQWVFVLLAFWVDRNRSVKE
jgi:hypothetical protein